MDAGPDEPVLNRPVDPDAGSDLHDMGGDIGPAADTAQSDRRYAGTREGSAEEVGTPSPAPEDTAMAISSTPPESPSQAGDGDAAPAPVPVTTEYVSIDEGETAGSGADGDHEARLAQKRQGGP